MDNSYVSKNKQNDYLGVNKIARNIRKTPLHRPNFVNNNNGVGSNPARQPSQPQVYNISKTDFRSIVQQLTGSPSRNDPLPRPPPCNPPKHPSMRLQRIRPPPLMPINRPQIPPQVHFNNGFGQPSPRGVASWTTPALSPISAYMQQLQSCIGKDGITPGQQMPPQMPVLGQAQAQHPVQPQYGQFQAQHPMYPQAHGQVQANSPSSGLLTNPNVPPLPSPGMSGVGVLPSPGGYSNLLSPTPWSPYPLNSPGSQFPPPLSPSFAFSPFGHSGMWGQGAQPPPSPGIPFPPSPSGFFPLNSPRWRDQ